MIIGIDYDGTWTLDRTFWDAFAALAVEHGHEVLVVTNRGPTNWLPIPEKLPVPVVYADGSPKKEAMKKTGKLVDVWIDDMPHLVDFGWNNPLCRQRGLD